MTTLLDAELPLDARVTAFLRDRAERPLSLAEIRDALQVSAESPELPAALARLTAAGEVVETHGRYGCPERMNLVVGTLSAHPDGFAFVVPNQGGRDLFINASHLETAVHGDRVVARVEHRRASGKLEGRVIRVLQRARKTVVGTLAQAGAELALTPHDRRLAFQVRLDDPGAARAGQVAFVEIDEYPGFGKAARGRLIEVLGEFGDPTIDSEIVIREFGLPHAFSAAALEEAASAGSEVVVPEGRTDFREAAIVTIDGESARDFDDAVHVERLPRGGFRLQVHIADVAHYVKQGSALDREARERGTSVYFPDRVVPMLPEALADELCSLKPGVDRLVQSVIIDIDAQGKTTNFEFHDGVIRSAARVTYTQVAAALGGDVPAELEAHRQHFETMRELAMELMAYRRRRGSIDFDLPEPEIVIDLRGRIEDIVRAERNVAHRIIEEFMIRANEVVASHLTWEGVRSPFRVHEGPDAEKVERLRDFIAGLGHTLGGGRNPQPSHFMELLERVSERPEERVVSTLLLRSMKQARYQVGNEGHFGLASPRYTHFTSPIRRYPDLVVHRLLRAERGAAPVDFDLEKEQASLESTCGDCSRLERRSEEAERAYCAGKKAQFMRDKLGEEFEGHITGVRSFGMFVELEPFFVEGLVPVSSLADDFYRFEEDHHRLRGERTGRTFRLGDRVRIRLAKVDLERRQLDFDLVDGPLALETPAPAPASAAEERSRRRRGGRRSGGRGRTRGNDRGRGEDRDRGDERPRSAAEASADEPVAASASAMAPEVAASPAGGADQLEGSDEGQRRRRRRGTRGGRNRAVRRDRERHSEGPAEGASAEPAQAAATARVASAESGGSPSTASAPAERQQRDSEQREGQSARADGDRQRRGDGQRREGESRGRSERRGEEGRRGRGNRPDRGRGRGRPERTERPAVRPAAAPAAAVTRNESTPKDQQPAVNPYLTDLDF